MGSRLCGNDRDILAPTGIPEGLAVPKIRIVMLNRSVGADIRRTDKRAVALAVAPLYLRELIG